MEDYTHTIYPLVNKPFANLKMAISFVDLPINSMVDLSSSFSGTVYQAGYGTSIAQ